ncbi:MAG: DedA family protein [Leptospiraceae bacterium]|nr:DedA family protein [Leptospiraceae bacterium]MCB1304073.1 DedA family protein [Leptospiraceae bacterium]
MIEHQIEVLIAYVLTLPTVGMYWFLFFSTILENLFPPWPGDTMVVLGGFLMAHDAVGFWGLTLVTLAGNMVGALIMYFAGEGLVALARHYQQYIKWEWARNQLNELTSPESMDRTSHWFRKWGLWFVIVSRFSAGIRFFVSIIAGISRINLILFSIAFAIGVIIWNTLLIYGGYALGENWRQIMDWLRVYNTVVIVMIILAVIGYLYWRFGRKKARPEP